MSIRENSLHISQTSQIGLEEEVLQESNPQSQTVAKGLKDIELAKQEHQLRLPQAGIRYQPIAQQEQGIQHGPYLIVGDKSKGVEPGFIAKKDWKSSDDEKLLNPKHKFNRIANELIQKWVRGEVDPPEGFHELAETAEKNKQLLSVETLKDHDVIMEAIKKHVMQSESKFQKNHYVKLDYYEQDKFSGKYHIPKDKAKDIFGRFFEKLGKWFHRIMTGETATKRNEGAVREVMANDLMREMGIQSQKLKLVPTQYADGTQKLLLDGTHIEGFNDFDGKPERGERYLKDGFLVKNDKNGNPKLDTSIEKMGRNKILLLLLADRDALGSKGGNKGYVGNQFFGIDPGHALETTLLNKKNDIYSDFSFKQPSVLEKKGYKNFSMFDQTSLSEKMEGVRQIKRLKESGNDEKVFDTYAEQFDGRSLTGGDNEARPELNFKEGIEEMKTGFIHRRDAILNVFEERLAVDNFKFGVEENSPQHLEKVDKTLNLLDGLEKLTSKTTGQTKSGIPLDIPQLKSPKDRVEWHIQQKESGELEFQFRGSKSQVNSMKRKIEQFIAATSQDNINLRDQESRGQGYSRTLTLTVPPEHLDKVAEMFDYGNIMEYKHGQR